MPDLPFTVTPYPATADEAPEALLNELCKRAETLVKKARIATEEAADARRTADAHQAYATEASLLAAEYDRLIQDLATN